MEKKVNSSTEKEIFPEVAQDSKSQESKTKNKPEMVKTLSQIRADILIAALEKQNTGVEVVLPFNALGQKRPVVMKKNFVPLFGLNALIASAHSDQMGAKTNVYTTYSHVVSRGESVRRGEHGFPIQMELWSDYVKKDDKNERISKKEYFSLDEESRKNYTPDRHTTTLFIHNIDQTTMHHVHEEEYDNILVEYGSYEERKKLKSDLDKQKEDKNLRMEVNKKILNIRDNLVGVTRDSSVSAAIYNSQKDRVHLPPQNKYDSYEEYVQDFFRKVAIATGHQGRLNNSGMFYVGAEDQREEEHNHEVLVVELASAIKMVELGLPAYITDNNRCYINSWTKNLKEEGYLDRLEKDVAKTLGIIAKAESGQKIEMRSQSALQDIELQKEMSNINFPEFEKISMIQDDKKTWMLYLKPEGETAFAIKPSYEDITSYFYNLKGQHPNEETEKFKIEMARKYYMAAIKDSTKKINLFQSNAPQEIINKIDKAIIFKTKESEKNPSKMLIYPTLTTGEKLPPKVLSENQWMRLWLAPDMRDYKKHLAAGMFTEEIKEVIAKEKEKQEQEQKEKQEKEKREQEQKEKESREKEKAKIALSPIVKQFLDLKKKHPDALLLFRCGDFYETYQKDAEEASRILGITLTKSSTTKDQDGNPLAMAGFPYHALETYLPKLIRAGSRVAICDQIEAPKEPVKRGITELLTPGSKNKNNLEAKAEEENKKIESSNQEEVDSLDEDEEEEQTRSRSFRR